MRFSTASVVESVCWEMRQADWGRSRDRAQVDDLFNGVPPFSPAVKKENNIFTNVNFLESTQLAQDARRQFYNAMMKPGNYFNVTLDSGPIQKRDEWARIITREINKHLKRSLPYMESIRSKFANVVLHGPGPVAWKDRQRWCPDALGVEDVLLPSRTLVSMSNLTQFAIFRSYTVEQLNRMTTGPSVDPGWKMPLVNQAIKWMASHPTRNTNTAGSDWYSPEKLSEMIKSDRGFYGTDAVPTIDCYDFFFYNDDDKESGWNRRIVLDGEWSMGGVSGDGPPAMPSTTKIGERGFLYDSGKRKYADKLGEIIHFQFGDLSAVAPFRYHSVRSLGFMLFAVCHLQNRLRCKFSDAVFESLLQYLRVHNLEEAERALKINLYDKAIIDDSVQFIPQAERWQVNGRLIEAALSHNREIMGANSTGYTQDYDFGKEQTEKTATQVNAESQSSASMVGAMLSQAYSYATFEYLEICRRFCLSNSIDGDVRSFRLNCLKAGVPESFIDHERWNVEPERVLGSGNKTLELNIADRLMTARPLFDPEPQQIILRKYALAVTDDPALTEQLVPENPVKVTDAVHDAQLASAALMMGLPVGIKSGINHIEYVETLLGAMGAVVQRVEQSGAMASQEQIIGLQNMAQHIAQHIQIISQDVNEKQRVKQYGDALGKIMNMVKAYAQRLQEKMQEQNGQSQGPDPEVIAKIQGQQAATQAKIASQKESHAEKTAQKRVSFDEKLQMDKEKHALELDKTAAQNQIEIAAQQAKTILAEEAAANKTLPRQ